MRIKTSVILFLSLFLLQAKNASAQDEPTRTATLSEIAGTWSFAMAGTDTMSMTLLSTGSRLVLVIKPVQGGMRIDTYHIDSDGYVNGEMYSVERGSYENGYLRIGMKAAFDFFSTSVVNFDIAMGSQEGNGSYSQPSPTAGMDRTMGIIAGVPSSVFTMNRTGTVTLKKISRSTEPPKSKPIKLPPSMTRGAGPSPMFVPSQGLGSPYGNYPPPPSYDYPAPKPLDFGSSRSGGDCTMRWMNCRNGCNGSTYGLPSDSKDGCRQACDIDRSGCR